MQLFAQSGVAVRVPRPITERCRRDLIGARERYVMLAAVAARLFSPLGPNLRGV
jgi:hypothetical protein